MCDQNIAVSIRTLNQMSSIIPNRMEKLKLASLSAGIVAGFTTDCFYSEDMSLAKGYDATVSDRVNDLSRVLKNYIVLNKSWFDTGARTISDARNIFITGRKHPLTTLGNIFSMVTLIEYNQNDMENGLQINAARSTLVKYGLSLDVPFYRLLTCAREKGLLVTLTGFREDIIKKAKRIDSHGQRLDILDETQISTVVSVVAGLIIAYTEPLPSTPVDFNDYYAVTAYPFAMSLTNQLVEKMQIDTTVLFGTYRSGLETRYELAFEPTTSVRGLMEVLINNNVLATDMAEAITNSNKGELLDYIVGMVKGVYDVRKEALERDVLHNLDYLPIDDNPISDMVNRPESHDEIQKRMEDLVASAEAILLENYNLTDKDIRDFKRISTETLSGRQALGIAMMIVGGALMAWAVYVTFFKKSAEINKKSADLQAKADAILDDTKKMLQSHSNAMYTNGLEFNKRVEQRQQELANRFNNQSAEKLTPNKVNDITKSKVTKLNKASKPTDVILDDQKYAMLTTSSEMVDLSSVKCSDIINKYMTYQKDMLAGNVDHWVIPERFKGIKSIEAFDDYFEKARQNIQTMSTRYGAKNLPPLSTVYVTGKQLKAFINNSDANGRLLEQMLECGKIIDQNNDRIDKVDFEGRAAEYEAAIKAGIPNISEEDLKECLSLIKKLNTELQNQYKILGTNFVKFNKNLIAWNTVAIKELATIGMLAEQFKIEDSKLTI